MATPSSSSAWRRPDAGTIRRSWTPCFGGGRLPLIRIMPNTPAAVGAGTILYAAQNVTDAQLNAFHRTGASWARAAA